MIKESKGYTIDTRLGRITGLEFDNYCEFRGVRYATAKRWHAPEVVKGWEGTYDAYSTFGKKCWQVHWDDPKEFYAIEYYNEFPHYDVEESEDCLFMTISVPREDVCPKPENGYPVAIWYHGGAYVHGWGTEAEFDGEGYATRGVILCRVNERLNIFGGFCHEKLIERDGTAGNYQLLDHMAAIDFVRANIADFGGDPDKIGLFGQSAGSFSTMSMLCDPHVENKVACAIMQSGISYGMRQRVMPDMHRSAEIFEEYLQSVGKTFEDFEKMPPEELFKHVYTFRDFAQPKGGGYSVVLDGDHAVCDYTTYIDEGRTPKIPVIIGCTANDMGAAASGDPKEGLFFKSIAAMCKTLNKQEGKKAYAYMFSHVMPGDNAGAFHAAELWYTFGTYPRAWRNLNTPQDKDLSDRMLDAWTNFFKTGCPDPAWRPYTEEDPFVKDWDFE